MKYLLQIHIGPMQIFIAAARRTRDLWFGSWLISELSKAAARGIAEQNEENQLIFPAPENTGDLKGGTSLGVSNKIVALVATPKAAAQAAKKALDARYDALIMTAALQRKLDRVAWQRADKQLHSFLEFYWVSYPLNGNYPHARAHANALLAARKNCRNFKPISWDGAGLPKSSLDGRMETVTPQPIKGKNAQSKKKHAQVMYKQFRARPAEQLSGVDLLKRLGQAEDEEKSRFPSTSHMAAMPLKAKLQAKANDPNVQEKWRNYLNKLPNEVKEQEVIFISRKLRLPILGKLDGGLLFESRLLDFMEKEETAVPKKALKKFLQAVDISDPNPYYALLVGDGDNMGKMINALLDDHNQMDEAIEKLEKWERHQLFSQKLAIFAAQAQKTVTEHDGAVVYAGGDDVLALLPLHTAVTCTKQLAEEFQSQMVRFKDKNGRSSTFSAGIAIVHHLEPLEDALNLARKAEKEAKSIDGKNALAIILNKRSGAPRMVAGRWDEIDVRLAQFAKHYRENELPHGLAYQLRDMYLHLGGETAVKENPTLQKVLAKEAGRIIKRKDGSKEAADTVTTAVAALDHKKQTIEALSSELIIAAEIAKAKETTP